MRNTLSEINQVLARGVFTTGDTVTITVYRNAGATAETISSNSCSEQGGTGVFIWPFSNLDTHPTTFSDYLYIMTNGASTVIGYERFGGWPDSVVHIEGTNTTTITVYDNQITPVAIGSVSVMIYNSDNTLLIDSKTTDTNGQSVFLLDDGSYNVRLSKPQVGFTIPETLTVSGITTQDYTGIPSTIVSGAGAGECEVSIFTASQRPSAKLSKLEGIATIKTLPTELDGVYYSGQKVDGNYDALTGRIYWVLPRGAVVFFKVVDIGINEEKTIPDSSAINYVDL